MANMLAELSRSRDEYFLAMMPLLVDSTMRALAPYLSSARLKPGIPLDGRQAMQPDVIMSMIYFSSETVPNEPSRSNSKGGLIDNRIGIVRARNACRMNIYWGKASSGNDRRQYGLTPKRTASCSPFC
jgi:hypothetical protein